MKTFLSSLSYGLPTGLAVAAAETASLETWLAAVVCFCIAIATTQMTLTRRAA